MDVRMPLYLQIKNALLERIDSGELLPGEKIASERDLAERYGVNRQTIRSAIDVLVEDGVLIKIPYQGSYVAKQVDSPSWGTFEDLNERRGFSDFLRDQGYSISSKVIIAEKVEPTNNIKDKLNLKKDEEVFCLERIRYSEGEPFSLERAYLPYKYVKGIEKYDFSEVSLYDFMESRGCNPYSFKKSMIVMFPDDRVARLLENRMYPIYSFQYTGYAKDGNISEYTQTYIRSDKVKYRFKI